jgi:hypothetical protein
MAGYVFEETVCDECGGTHTVYLEEDGAFDVANRYVYVCSQTAEIAVIRRFSKVVAAASRPAGSIVGLPG